MNVVLYLHDEPSKDNFEKKIQWLKKHYTFISSQDIYNYYYRGYDLKNVCHLTVDDGWLSTYQVIFPILRKYGIPMSIFVSPYMSSCGKHFWYMESKGIDESFVKNLLVERKFFSPDIMKFPLDLIFKEMKIDDVYSVLEECRDKRENPLITRNIVNIEELLEMHDSGLVEIGAHTQLHPVLANECIDKVHEEIKLSIEGLSDILKHKIMSFAYPNGIPGMDFGRREMEIVAAYDIKLAYSVQPGILNKSKSPLMIPRVGSIQRLKLGYLGLKIPSLHDQVKPRLKIRDCKLF